MLELSRQSWRDTNNFFVAFLIYLYFIELSVFPLSYQSVYHFFKFLISKSNGIYRIDSNVIFDYSS